MPKFKNISGVRLSLKIAGKKGLTFIDAGDEIYLSKDQLAELADSKYVLDGYLAQVQNQPKAPEPQVMEEPKEEPVEAPKKGKRGKK